MTIQQTQTVGWQRMFNAAVLMTTYLLGTTTRKFSNNVANIGGGAITAWAGLSMLQTVNADSAVDLQSGLVAYYPFNGNANDESGNGHHGTVMGATLTSDRFGRPNKAYHFNGLSSYIMIPATSDLQPAYISISVWARRLCGGYGWQQIVSATGYTNRYMITWYNDVIRECITSYTCLNSNPVIDNNWHHITITHGQGSQRLYVDGVLSSNQIAISPIEGYNTEWIAVGAEDNYGSHKADCCYFCGDIAEIRIYNRALTANEITALYNEQPTLKVDISPRTYAVLTLKTLGNANLFPEEADWTVLKESTDANVAKSIYFGRAYVNHDVKAIVITHCALGFGISTFNPVSPVVGASETEWLSNIDDYPNLFGSDHIVRPEINVRFKSAKIFIEYIINNIMIINNLNIYDISFTGFSIGAAIAELASAQYQYKAVTFESPGTLNLINEQFGINRGNKIVTYCTAPNLGNSIFPHAGLLYRVYPNMAELYDDVQFKEQPSREFYQKHYLSNQHNLINIINEFDAHNGQPKVYGVEYILADLTQLKWPDGSDFIGFDIPTAKYAGYNHYRSPDLNSYYLEQQANNIVSHDVALGFVDKWFSAFFPPVLTAGWEFVKLGEYELKEVALSVEKDVIQWAVDKILTEVIPSAAMVVFPELTVSGVILGILRVIYDNPNDIVSIDLKKRFYDYSYCATTREDDLGSPWGYDHSHCQQGAIIIGDKDFLCNTNDETAKRLSLLVDKTCNTVSNDYSDKVIQGATNFNDVVYTGKGNDIHYLFAGNDISYDYGGYDEYHYPFFISGNKIIYDYSDSSGSIWIGNYHLQGFAVPITHSSCAIIHGGAVGGMTKLDANIAAYILFPSIPPDHAIKENNIYYLIKEGPQLFISRECPLDRIFIQNSITLNNFNWGKFNIHESQLSWVVMVSGLDKETLDCTNLHENQVCVAWAFGRIPTFRSDRITNNIFILSNPANYFIDLSINTEGPVDIKSIIGFIPAAPPLPPPPNPPTPHPGIKKFLSTSVNMFPLIITGIKNKDIIDFSSLNSSININQNGTLVTIDLGNNSIIYVNSYLFHNFNVSNNIITVNSQGVAEAFVDEYLTIRNATLTISNSRYITGTEDDDILIGNNNDNIIQGLGGNDALEGKGGADVLDGGDGIDTTTYISSPQGVIVNLNGSAIGSNTTSQFTTLSVTIGFGKGGDAEGDILINIENIIGSNYSDVLTGSLLPNVMQTLQGGIGNDVLVAVSYNSTLFGGEGVDIFNITGTAYNTTIADFAFEKIDLTSLSVQYAEIQKFQTGLECIINFTVPYRKIFSINLNNVSCVELARNNFIINVPSSIPSPDLPVKSSAYINEPWISGLIRAGINLMHLCKSWGNLWNKIQTKDRKPLNNRGHTENPLLDTIILNSSDYCYERLPSEKALVVYNFSQKQPKEPWIKKSISNNVYDNHSLPEFKLKMG